MRILVTGASGFTGRWFIREAEERGHVLQSLQADITDREALDDELEGMEAEAVMHLAALSHVADNDPAELYKVNVVGTTNLLSAVARWAARPRCVLLVSSAYVYGNSPITPISESTAPAPLNHYAASKTAMEFLARTFSDRLPIGIVRPFNYTGPGQSAGFLIPKLLESYVQLSSFIELGNTHVSREFNDVRMVCDAYVRLLEKRFSSGCVNVCSGTSHRLAEVIAMLEEVTGHQLEIRTNPVLVRSNEIETLCGDPRRLRSIIGPSREYSLIETLRLMRSACG